MADSALAQDFRRCSRCLTSRAATRENFSFIKSKGKWHPWCKPCCAEQRRHDRAARPEHYAEISRQSKTRHRDAVRARVRARYWETRDEKLEAERERQRANRERYAANRRRKRLEDPVFAERLRRQAAARREASKATYRSYAKKSWAGATAQRRLRTYFTSAICHSLNGSTKGGRSWELILGYTASDLRAHLERQFARGKSWDNYGEWHVDHILPVASFQFESADDPEFRACWALTNLRPLWAGDNIRKSDNRLHLI